MEEKTKTMQALVYCEMPKWDVRFGRACLGLGKLLRFTGYHICDNEFFKSPVVKAVRAHLSHQLTGSTYGEQY